MLTIYFTIPFNCHQLTLEEIRKSDSLHAGMLESVYETNAGVVYSWHDLKDEDVTKVLKYITENIGNYQTTIEYEDINDGLQENTLLTITIDADTHMTEILHAPAWMLPDYFDQTHVVEIISEETGELLYAETEEIGDCDYIATDLMEFLKEIDFI